ncbi:MAG: NADH-quinone oxidoreductase subunit J [Epsilonproteobacteria bacterium]|nr:MAG: NADH-quinone oxidoreductase subunit J [Campylobacterota bacterium]
MTIEGFAFYFFSVLTIGLFSVTVMSKNVLYAMTSLAAGMVLISGFFFILGADFLGVVQLIVYVGAIMALYSFAMMFFDATRDIKEKNTSNALVFLLGGLSALVLVLMFAAPIMSDSLNMGNLMVEYMDKNISYVDYIDGNISKYAQYSLDHGIQASVEGIGNAQSVGVILFTKYLIPFEVAAVMLLVAMIAGIILAGKKMDDSLTEDMSADDEIMIVKDEK